MKFLISAEKPNSLNFLQKRFAAVSGTVGFSNNRRASANQNGIQTKQLFSSCFSLAGYNASTEPLRSDSPQLTSCSFRV
jgi:hypothetical protein